MTLGLQKDGSLWAWAGNGFGQLGLSETRIGRTPTQAGSVTAWAAVACGYDFGLAREEVRHPLSLGFNGNSELGCGDAKERHTSTEVDSGMGMSVWSCPGFVDT